MPRDGSGNYSAPAGQPVVPGTTISSTVHNNLVDDLIAVLTASISRDGQTTPTANLPMGGFKHTGVAEGTLRTHYSALSQVQDAAVRVVNTVIGTNTISGTLSPPISTYAPGMVVVLVPVADNTATVTLALNGLPAKNINKFGTLGLVASDMKTGVPAYLVYASAIGTGEWLLVNPRGTPLAQVAGLGTLASQNGTFSGTHSGTSSGTNTGDQTITLGGDVTGSGTASITAAIAAATVLTKLLGVDGSGSGLDADLVDGQHAAAFAAVSHNHTAAEVTSGALAEARGGTGNSNGTARNISGKTGVAKTLQSGGTASGGADGDITYIY